MERYEIKGRTEENIRNGKTKEEIRPGKGLKVEKQALGEEQEEH